MKTKMKSSKTKTKAIREFDILEKTVKDAVIVPFRDEILALVEKFGQSGQSGWWTSAVKDEKQLDEVFEYYDRYENA